ncbi:MULTISPECIES: hypothetical protein [Paenibacillus]|uniref:Uncharacterized protein n=1 Tax=Paenibacillus odorifer TaxID=189426 RepID=A0A1R0ZLR9_9BACL|nr:MULTISPECIES: hypothetical protein [Paenibacillus]AIQ24475.1 hypothetical protein H70737_17445 [Paenibacillus sp. FSL H7-0737]OMD54142.1 hypothetical protein BSK51_08150 [Paenibacillus odorifer]OME73040.1 hypothetical protein BSK65_04350 [Paenibacillus odorifer]
MSYDLMAFETSKAPQERAAFMKWYEQQVQWSEDHAYNDPSVLSEALQRFYSELSEQFPNMNVEDEIFEAMEEAGTDNRLTDYSLGSSVIYAAFAYSVAEEAYTAMRELAIKHKVGFFDVSSNEGDIIFP